MTREAVAAVLSRMDGAAHLVATRLYGSGVRSREAVRLRGKDIDVQMKQLTVRSGQGDKDRFSTVPATLPPLLQTHLAGVKTWPQQDLAQGHGEVSRPHALARQAPHAAKAGQVPAQPVSVTSITWPSGPRYLIS
jgi:integrase